MPVLMAAQKEAQFDHVMKNPLQHCTSSLVVDALEKCFEQGCTACKDIGNILGMFDANIDSLACNADVTDD